MSTATDITTAPQDLQLFVNIMNTALEFLKKDITVFGVTFSFWQFALYTVIASIVIWAVAKFTD